MNVEDKVMNSPMFLIVNNAWVGESITYTSTFMKFNSS